MDQLTGQFVVVTGLPSSLRDAAVARIEREGAKVAVFEASADAVRAAADQAGRLDAVVNVLKGHENWGPFVDDDSVSLRAMFDQVVDFTEALRAAYPYLKASQGRAVNVCSLFGSTAVTHIAPAVAADGALQGLTRSIGAEWAKDGIQVNCIVPAAIDVPEFRAFRDRHPTEVDHRVNSLPLHRLGDPVEDFGGALMMLLSDEACFLVGHVVHADGGQHLSAPVFEPGANLTAIEA